jgi:conjugative transfer signal peptidase TraF
MGRCALTTASVPHELRIASSLGGPLLLLVACLLGGLGGLRLNLTGSLPVGLYAVTRGAPTRGALVLVCLPRAGAEFARDRGYVPRGGSCPGGVMPVGKPVFAIPGDSVTVSPDGLLLNGRLAPNSRPLTVDRQGRPLVGLPVRRYVVAPGELWVVSHYSMYSFDSRYFGPVPTSHVRARVRSIWTVRSDGIDREADAPLGKR